MINDDRQRYRNTSSWLQALINLSNNEFDKNQFRAKITCNSMFFLSV